jgi:DNA-binding transcriptional LysR family regulator
MKHNLPPLDGLKVFESAARHLSFSLAAEELCITKGAVSYQIRKLEENLDCALFRRSVRQVYLTNAGQELLQTTQRLFKELTRSISQISPGDSEHDVLVGATTYVSLRWLSSRIARFNEQYPEVRMLLQHAVNAEDFRFQDVDFAIRWDEMKGHGARSLLLELPMSLFPVCSPLLLQRIKSETGAGDLDVQDLSNSPLNSTFLLCEDRRLDLWQAWYGTQQRPLQNPRQVIADANVRTQAAIDGQGWTLADGLMQRELDSGALIAPFKHRLQGFGYAIQSAPGRYLNQHAQKLRDWLIANV